MNEIVVPDGYTGQEVVLVVEPVRQDEHCYLLPVKDQPGMVRWISKADVLRLQFESTNSY